MNKSKEVVFKALDILGKINMDYDKFSTDCARCKLFGLGNITHECGIEGYCPTYLSDADINTLTKTFL